MIKMSVFIFFLISAIPFTSWADDGSCLAAYKAASASAIMLDAGRATFWQSANDYLTGKYHDGQTLYLMYIEAKNENTPVQAKELVDAVGLGPQLEPWILRELVNQIESGKLCKTNGNSMTLNEAAVSIRQALSP